MEKNLKFELKAEWSKWRNNLDRITSHPDYRYEAQRGPQWRNHALLLKLMRFTQSMLGVTNTQFWNPRNPAPFLP